MSHRRWRRSSGRGRRHGPRHDNWLDLFGHGRRRGGGPIGLRRRFFEAGEVRLALLSLLGDAPAHGYELMKQLEERSGGLYRASAGTIYPKLQQLADEGLIRAEERDGGKRTYALTPDGEAELAAQAEAVQRIWDRAESWGDWSDLAGPQAGEIAAPALRIVQSAMRAAAGGDPDRVDAVRHILRDTARKLDALRSDD